MIKYMTPLSNELYCSLCKDIYENPFILLCGHTFCLKCIQSCIPVMGTKCPRCHHPFKYHDILPDTFIMTVLQEQLMRCQHPQCGWEGTLFQYKKHFADCPGLAEFSHVLSMAFNKNHKSSMKRKPKVDAPSMRKRIKEADDEYNL